MSEVITPTVARIVWYFPGRGNLNVPGSGDQPCAAIVTYVNNDRSVNLRIFTKEGFGIDQRNVSFRQPGDPENPLAHCEWMPYQVEQAEKHKKLLELLELLEKKKQAPDEREQPEPADTKDPELHTQLHGAPEPAKKKQSDVATEREQRKPPAKPSAATG